MPALTSITVADGASTPVNHEFVPAGKPVAGVSEFRNTDGVAVGDNVLTVSSSLNARRKVSIRFKLPQTATQTLNGVSSEIVTKTAYVRMDFDFAADSTLIERKDAVAFASNILGAGQTEVREVLLNLRDFY